MYKMSTIKVDDIIFHHLPAVFLISHKYLPFTNENIGDT